MIRAWQGGDEAARNELFRVLEPELRRVARHHLRLQGLNCSRQTGDLINELYYKLARSGRVTAESRGEFFALVIKTIRRLLIDWARARGAQQRGGQLIRMGMEYAEAVPAEEEASLKAEILALRKARQKLRRTQPELVKVFDPIYFGDRTVKETAELLGMSEPQVRRRWKLAIAWLTRELSGGNRNDKGGSNGTGPKRAI